MPELGKYATEVLSAYGVTIAILAVLIWASVLRARHTRTALEAAEADATDG